MGIWSKGTDIDILKKELEKLDDRRRIILNKGLVILNSSKVELDEDPSNNKSLKKQQKGLKYLLEGEILNSKIGNLKILINNKKTTTKK